MTSQSTRIQVKPEQEGLRLDQLLALHLATEESRSQIQRWIREGHVQGPGELKPSRRVVAGEEYEWLPPPPPPADLEAVDLDLKFLFEDAELAVLHKPPGIAVHPGPGDRRPSIVHGLVHVWQEQFRAEFRGEETLVHRPGVVHRLDRDTEGLLVVARTALSHRRLARQFAERSVRKEYLAWLLAAPRPDQGRIEQPIARHPRERTRMRLDPAGRMAITEYRSAEQIISRHGRKYASVQIAILTGRTHQIRVHMSALGAPVVGDPIYSRSAREYARFGMLLLAQKLSFRHPISGEELSFELPLPERFRDFQRLASAL